MNVFSTFAMIYNYKNIAYELRIFLNIEKTYQNKVIPFINIALLTLNELVSYTNSSKSLFLSLFIQCKFSSNLHSSVIEWVDNGKIKLNHTFDHCQKNFIEEYILGKYKNEWRDLKLWDFKGLKFLFIFLCSKIYPNACDTISQLRTGNFHSTPSGTLGGQLLCVNALIFFKVFFSLRYYRE